MNEENLLLAFKLIPIECLNTLYMVFASLMIAVVFGLPIGIMLTITSKGHIAAHLSLHRVLEHCTNIARSFPFAILMVALIPVTRFFVGTSLGTTASIIPLSIAAIPAFARNVELALKEVEKSLVEAAEVMGSTKFQIIAKVLLPEALPSLIQAATSVVIYLIGYSAMAGLMGGGGLGKIAIQYGYYQFNIFLMGSTIVVLLILLQGIQSTGNYFAHQIQKTRGKTLKK